MKIAILGAGAIGSLIGSILAKGGADVWLVDPYKDHMNKIANNGLKIEYNTGGEDVIKMNAVCTPEEAGECDLVIILTKGMYTKEAVKGAKALFRHDTIAITMQNGMGNVETLAEILPPDNVGYGVLQLGSQLLEPGHIKAKIHPITKECVHFKSFIKDSKKEKYEELAKYFYNGGINAKYSDAVDEHIWKKMMANCAANLVCAITRLTTGCLSKFDEGMKIQEDIIREIVAVANADGMKFDFDKIWDNYVNNMLPNVLKQYPSAAQDAMKKRKTEAEFLNGAICKKGRKYNIPTPVNDTITNLMKIIENTYGEQFQ